MSLTNSNQKNQYINSNTIGAPIPYSYNVTRSKIELPINPTYKHQVTPNLPITHIRCKIVKTPHMGPNAHDNALVLHDISNNLLLYKSEKLSKDHHACKKRVHNICNQHKWEHDAKVLSIRADMKRIKTECMIAFGMKRRRRVKSGNSTDRSSSNGSLQKDVKIDKKKKKLKKKVSIEEDKENNLIV